MKLTVGQAIIEFLSNQYVEQLDGSTERLIDTILGIYGHGNVAGLGEAIAHSNKIKYIRGQNEQGLGHIAVAYSKENNCRKIMGVTSSIGPGATTMNGTRIRRTIPS